MKTTFTSAISIIIFMMFFAPGSKAQNLTYRDAASVSSTGLPKSSPSKIEETNMTGIEKINPKLLNRFNKNFHDATNVKWQQFGDKFLATFSTGEKTTRSLFYKNGKTIYTINYFTGNQLPQVVKRLVKDQYEDYIITTAAQVLQENREIWVVQLAGLFHYKTVRVENGEMEEVESFQKSN